MEILEIKDINFTPGHIYYRRTYHGVAVISLPINTIEPPIHFTIETGPMGNRDIDVTVDGAIDYPLLPIKTALKEFISTMDSAGELKC